MNRGEPSDDLSKIRGEILSSGDPFTLPRTDTCTECSYGKVDSWVWNLGGWVAPINLLSFSSTQGGADTPARITGDGYKNGGEVNSTRRHSGMDVDPSGRDNHSGPGRGGDHSQEPKRLSPLRGKPYESLK
ncbi:reverse transcriptase [Cucumis melo var. makuwa]|uniref:Reverse transcriptase n=1 Tax=Cucumis melo var. makuwa TaxID=1194695 RepID=A0A5A7TWJ9_CUCMM|nr:reverse transcriptase [Cucumis melo var. makuwa]TYK26900.1 reverse transcriptase [Cucumis melo var. makuwa]